mgnify:CR=1 FL=1
MSKTLAVIPARLDSSRFPNKPLKEILGIPMVAHCLYRAKFSKKIDSFDLKISTDYNFFVDKPNYSTDLLLSNSF